MTTTTETCGKCDGKKILSWTRNAEGVCFACGGAGVLSVTVEELAPVRRPRASVIAALKLALDALSKVEDSYDLTMWSQDRGWSFGQTLAHADEDVRTRALAAFEAACPRDCFEHEMFLISRHERHERATLAAKVRKVVKGVKRVA